MSALRSWNILCDACGDRLTPDDTAQTAQEARQTARDLEHHVGRPGGKDICSGCWDLGVRLDRAYQVVQW